MSVFLSAGHSDVDPGAVANGRKEADIAVDFRNIVAYCLLQEGASIALDGSRTENWPLARAAKEARKHRVAVEFHCNASDKPQATGVETLSDATDRPLAKALSASLSKVLGLRNRGAKPENSGQHARLAFVQAGGIIVELFFITNPTDLKAYDDYKWIAARDIARILKAHDK